MTLALRDQELCGGALVCWGGKHRVGISWRKFGHQRWQLYFQDLPIYNKLISLQERWGKKTSKEPQNVAPPPRRPRSSWARRSGSCSLSVTNYTNQLDSYQSLESVISSFKICFQIYGQLKKKKFWGRKKRSTFLKFELSRVSRSMLKSQKNAIRNQFEQPSV